MKINTYAVNCNDAWLNTDGDDISGSYVKYKDHQDVVADLEAKCSALAAELKQSQIDAGCYKNGMEASNERLVQVAAENAGLNAFVDALISIAWQGGSADGADIEELALKHGLIRQEIYSADEHENQVDDPGNFEDGDPVYFRVEAPATDAFLADVRAQGVEMLLSSLPPHYTARADIERFAAQLRKGASA